MAEMTSYPLPRTANPPITQVARVLERLVTPVKPPGIDQLPTRAAVDRQIASTQKNLRLRRYPPRIASSANNRQRDSKSTSRPATGWRPACPRPVSKFVRSVISSKDQRAAVFFPGTLNSNKNSMAARRSQRQLHHGKTGRTGIRQTPPSRPNVLDRSTLERRLTPPCTSERQNAARYPARMKKQFRMSRSGSSPSRVSSGTRPATESSRKSRSDIARGKKGNQEPQSIRIPEFYGQVAQLLESGTCRETATVAILESAGRISRLD